MAAQLPVPQSSGGCVCAFAEPRPVRLNWFSVLESEGFKATSGSSADYLVGLPLVGTSDVSGCLKLAVARHG